MRAALALGERGRGRTAPNPHVGCILVRDRKVVGCGWTRPGGRPHAEADALARAGERARGATAYTTLEPCAHRSTRGPTCAAILAEAGVARVVAAMTDPDPRTAGTGFAQLRAAGVEVETGVLEAEARRAHAGFLSRTIRGRPRVTLKLAQSIDGRIAMPSGESRWITGPDARRHGHWLRAKSDAILVGRGTWDADQPRLDVRLPGLEDRSPRRYLLTSRPAPKGWAALHAPEGVFDLTDVNDLLVEGGAQTSAAFLRADLVDRLFIYTAPVLLGAGRSAVGDFGLESLPAAHDRWTSSACRMLGPDRLDIYERLRD